MTQSGAANATTVAPGAGMAGLFVQISGVLDRIHAQYQELETVSRSQDALLERDDGDELLELLAARQVIVDRLSELDRTFVPLRLSWEQSAPTATPAQRARVTERLDAINDLALWVALRDSAATLRLQQRRDALGEELASLGRSKVARNAYESSRSEGPRFQDREG